MTAPAAEAHPAPMEMFERYPSEHPKAGSRVVRERACSCGEKFYQAMLSPAWLDRMPAHQSKTLVDQATEIDRGQVWLPRACPKCERRALNQPPALPHNPTTGGP